MEKKLRGSGGETLVEVLASILIGALSVALLFGSIMASANITRQAQNSDEDYYKNLSAAEARTAPGENGTLTVNDSSLDITIYGGGGTWSYARKEP